MLTTISNSKLTAKVRHKGAELVSLVSNDSRLEYIWQADPAYWAKSSPVLFPFVGQLKNNEYVFEGKTYRLPRHGFARDMDFHLESVTQSSIVFLLESTNETRENYPFDFELRITYAIRESQLDVSYEVKAVQTALWFSLGAHPAFNVPLLPEESYQDYYLEFANSEHVGRWRINSAGLITASTEPVLKGENILPLKKELFYEDALVFKDLASTTISIRSRKATHGVAFSFEGFPYFGIWAWKDADFVCLEPWCGIADHESHDQRLEQKEGIIHLPIGTPWKRSWAVRCF